MEPKYKQKTNIRRLPLGNQFDDKTYMTDWEMKKLLTGEYTIEEKLDGEPIIIEQYKYTLYGEYLASPRSIHYSNLPAFVIIYDVWSKDKQEWVSDNAEKESICREFGFPSTSSFVVVGDGNGTISDVALDLYLNDKSEFSSELQYGIVIKNYHANLFGTLIRSEFIDGITKPHVTKPRKRSTLK